MWIYTPNKVLINLDKAESIFVQDTHIVANISGIEAPCTLLNCGSKERSEEGLAALAESLSAHGFGCTIPR